MGYLRLFERALLFISISLVFVLYRRPQAAPTLIENATKITASTGACVPHVPPSVFEDEAVLSHPAVLEALSKLNQKLGSLVSGSPDAVSVAVVHSSTGKIFSFHHGETKLNESTSQIAPQSSGGRPVDGDSIFRVASVTKTFVVLEALILSEQSMQHDKIPRLTLETKLKDVLPGFALPEKFKGYRDEITLAMLGSHRAGLTRDLDPLSVADLRNVSWHRRNQSSEASKRGFVSDHDQHVMETVEAAGRIKTQSTFQWPYGPIDDHMSETEEAYLEKLKKAEMLFKPGEMPSYSNTGFNLFGFALEAYYKNLTKKSAFFADLATADIIDPLKMKHSFFGEIPPDLNQFVTVPYVDNMVDVGEYPANDPAGGMFSSSNDLAAFMQDVLLSPNPSLVTAAQRQSWLRPAFVIPDGESLVGIPWEISTLSGLQNAPTYQVYGKGGMLPGHYSMISIIPELGYGVVGLVALGCSQDDFMGGRCNKTAPRDIYLTAHKLLSGAFLTAYHDIMSKRLGGLWTSSASFAAESGSNATAKIELYEGNLWLRQFSADDGFDLLKDLDTLMLPLVGGKERMFDTGARLWPTGFEGVFRAVSQKGCDWGEFDLFHSVKGMGVDKVVFETYEESDELELVYEPLNLRLRRQK